MRKEKLQFFFSLICWLHYCATCMIFFFILCCCKVQMHVCISRSKAGRRTALDHQLLEGEVHMHALLGSNACAATNSSANPLAWDRYRQIRNTDRSNAVSDASHRGVTIIPILEWTNHLLAASFDLIWFDLIWFDLIWFGFPAPHCCC